MERYIGQGMGEAQSVHDPTRHTTLPECPHVHQAISSLNPLLLAFYIGFITYALMIKSLAVAD